MGIQQAGGLRPPTMWRSPMCSSNSEIDDGSCPLYVTHVCFRLLRIIPERPTRALSSRKWPSEAEWRLSEHSCRPRPCLRQAGKWIMYRHAQRLKMPQVAGQDGQPVVLGGGGDDDVGEAGGMTLATGAV